MRKLTLSGLGAAALILAATTATAAPPANNHRLDVSFALADKNKDGFLDADELAKSFRGPNAKVIADKVGTKGEAHPDHAFMDAWDTNKDGKISKAEFEKYEAKVVADARVAATRNENYTRAGRAGYRAPQRHRGYTAGRGYGINPYTAMLRYQQRAYQQQRAAYSNLMRYGSYSPNVRGGYRGVQRHHHNGRRR